MRLASAVNNRQVRDNPTVQYLNAHEHFLRITRRALTESVIEISGNGKDFHLCAQFLCQADANWSFASGMQFLYLRRAVRCSNSHELDVLWRELDVLWRENVSSARTSDISCS